MNHNTQPTNGSEWPRHRGNPTQTNQTRLSPSVGEQAGEAFIQYLVEGVPTTQMTDRIREICSHRRTAFAVYLAFPDVDEHAATVEADFESAYIGFYPDRQAFVRDTIDSFGWEQDLDRLLLSDPLLRAMVVLSKEQVLGFVQDHYELVELGDGLYVFEAAPPTDADIDAPPSVLR